MAFGEGVTDHGPIGIYRMHFGAGLYNHPPLMGYLLQLVTLANRQGLAFPLVIRVPAIVADAVTSFLVFEMLRKRRSLQRSLVAAASVAASPVLFVISGYHGNTDPLFVMFALLSVYLLVDRGAPIWAGLAIAVALGVKIVPVVVVPTLLVFAFTAGRRTLIRFCLASGALLALTWGPVVLSVWAPFRKDVLGYAGGHWKWGLPHLASSMGADGFGTWLQGPGRFVVVLIVAVVPAALTLKRPGRAVEASALALTGMLALSPAFALQYVAWAVAPAYLLSFPAATAFNLLASGLVIEVYDRWSGGFPWYFAEATYFTSGEVILALAVWVSLMVVVVAGIVDGKATAELRPA